jgi:hypothetical protein
MEAEVTGDGPAGQVDAWPTAAPPLGVHVLSEFTFCPRAGLITLGMERTDWGDDYWLTPNLDYRPAYALYELRREFLATLLATLGLGAAAGAVLAGCVVLFRAGNAISFAAGVPLFLALLWAFGRRIARLQELRAQWHRIRTLAPREPDPEATEPQPVIWWELLRAGYDPVRLPEPIHSPVSRLTGRPWRILRKGEFQIPVFRVEGEGPEKLYPKHAVRAAAYCALLEQSAGARSPYAIALFAGTYNGWTLPNSIAARAFLDKALAAARTYLTPEMMIGPPASLGLCAGCPHGAPRPYRRGETETTLFGGPLRPHGSAGRDGRVYHSACGDRFGWTPPHKDAIALGMRAEMAGANLS